MVVFRPTEQSLIFIQKEEGNGFQFEIQKAMIASFEITGQTLSTTTCNITTITIVQYCEKQCKWHSAKFKGFVMERIKIPCVIMNNNFFFMKLQSLYKEVYTDTKLFYLALQIFSQNFCLIPQKF